MYVTHCVCILNCKEMEVAVLENKYLRRENQRKYTNDRLYGTREPDQYTQCVKCQ